MLYSRTNKLYCRVMTKREALSLQIRKARALRTALTAKRKLNSKTAQITSALQMQRAATPTFIVVRNQKIVLKSQSSQTAVLRRALVRTDQNQIKMPRE